jgi:hypothetical protein
VLGRFWESIRKDSILLVIFAGEREDSIQIQRIDSESAMIPLPKSAKTRLKGRLHSRFLRPFLRP